MKCFFKAFSSPNILTQLHEVPYLICLMITETAVSESHCDILPAVQWLVQICLKMLASSIFAHLNLMLGLFCKTKKKEKKL